MTWDFTATQIIDGEYDIKLTDFTKKLYAKTVEMAAMSIEASVSTDNVIDTSLNPLEDYQIQYFICYYNYLLCLATGRSRRQFVSHTKKIPFATDIKKRFIDKKFLAEIEASSKDAVDIFMAVLKLFVSDMIESGTSNNRLPQMLLMQQLNSFSSIIPNIMKNAPARGMLMPIEFSGGFMNGKLKKIFK